MGGMATHDEQPRLAPSTTAVKGGRPEGVPDAPLNAPLEMASTYVAGGDIEYGRYGNRSWEALESVVGELEGGRAISFASGMAAVATILDIVSPGATVVAPQHCYQGTLVQLARLEQRGSIKVVLVDIDDTEQVVGALGDDVALLWIESPTNPALEVADIPALCAAAHAAGARVVVDNTFATPLVQQPISDGADVVIHSGTKYLSGHGDAVIGFVITADDEIWTAVDERRRTLGAIPGTLEAWLTLRGIRTLHLRVERATSNAQELVRRMADHPALEEVRYPGFGGIIAIVVAGGAEAADRVVAASRLWVHATSLGGVESTFERRRRWAGEPHTIPAGLIRLSVGIEDVDDLWRDLVGRTGCRRLGPFGLRGSGDQLAQELLRRHISADGGRDSLDDRHVDPVSLGQVADRLARLDSFGDLTGCARDLVD